MLIGGCGQYKDAVLAAYILKRKCYRFEKNCRHCLAAPEFIEMTTSGEASDEKSK